MKQIIIILLMLPFCAFAQDLQRGETGGTEATQPNSSNGDRKVEKTRTVNCSEDLELDPGNKLIYHKKTQKPFSGMCISYYYSGGLQRKASFLNGKDNDTSYAFYESGDMEAKIIHVGGVENGTWAYWYDNGKDMGAQQLAWANTYAMGAKIGQWYFFDSLGNPTKYLEYQDDKLNGDCKYYYPGGDINKTIQYKDGKFDGEYVKYYEDSVLKSKREFKNGKAEGAATSYYESGALKTERSYKNDLPDGKLTIYFENSQIKQECTFKEGKEDGLLKVYLEGGKNATTVLYDDGVILKTVEYDRFGNPKNEMDVVELEQLMTSKQSSDSNDKKKKKKEKKEKKSKKNKEEDSEEEE